MIHKTLHRKKQGGKMDKQRSILSAVCSFIVWGSGQAIFAKQYIKGLFFFLIQTGFISIELFTGYWIENIMGLVPVFDIRVHGGFFTKGIWGFITLGSVPREDHSIQLMIMGIIVLIMLLLFLMLGIYITVDAYKSQMRYEATKEKESFKDYLKNMIDKSFAQIVLSPVLLLFLAVTVMPIAATVLIGFTNYSKTNLPPANIVEWVGFENFTKLFTVPIWSSTFFGVLSWTLTWAVLVTFISYFLACYKRRYFIT